MGGNKMKWDRERYIAHSLFEDTGREMFCELFGPLHVLEDEWRAQGASDKEIGMSAFDWDYVPMVSRPVKQPPKPISSRRSSKIPLK